MAGHATQQLEGLGDVGLEVSSGVDLGLGDLDQARAVDHRVGAG